MAALTQLRGFGAHVGRRYGAFAGKTVGAHPVGRITQALAHAAHTGRRYGSFAGREGVEPPAPPPEQAIPGRPQRRIRVSAGLRKLQLDDDELLLHLAAQAIAAGLLH